VTTFERALPKYTIVFMVTADYYTIEAGGYLDILLQSEVKTLLEWGGGD